MYIYIDVASVVECHIRIIRIYIFTMITIYIYTYTIMIYYRCNISIDNNNNNDDDNHDNSDNIHQWITTIRIIGSYWYYPPVD